MSDTEYTAVNLFFPEDEVRLEIEKRGEPGKPIDITPDLKNLCLIVPHAKWGAEMEFLSRSGVKGEWVPDTHIAQMVASYRAASYLWGLVIDDVSSHFAIGYALECVSQISFALEVAMKVLVQQSNGSINHSGHNLQTLYDQLPSIQKARIVRFVETAFSITRIEAEKLVVAIVMNHKNTYTDSRYYLSEKKRLECQPMALDRLFMAVVGGIEGADNFVQIREGTSGIPGIGMIPRSMVPDIEVQRGLDDSD